MNTAMSTAVDAITGPVTSVMPSVMARRESQPFSVIRRTVFSVTRMASSTTMPITRIKPKRVRLLIDIPRPSNTANVPINETGMVMAGISVVRQSCKKTQTTKITRRMAMTRVSITSSMDAVMYSVAS